MNNSLEDPTLAVAHGWGLERVEATTDLSGRNIVPDPTGRLVGARVTYRGHQGTLTASPEAGGYWTVRMKDGGVHSLRASQFSVVGVEPEPVEAPTAAPDPEPENGGDLGEEEKEEGGVVDLANRAFVLPTSAVRMVDPSPDLSEVRRLSAIADRHRAAIVAPEIDTTTGTERTRLIASREAEEEARHAAGRAAAFEWLRTP